MFHSFGPPEFISFDHDLGGEDTAMKYVDWVIDLALDLIDLGVDKKLIRFPRNYTIHSQNPIGAQAIDSRMKSFIQHLDQ